MPERGASRGAAWLLALVLTGVATWLVLNSPIFAVRDIRVLGNVRLTADEVVALAGVEEGDNLFQVSAGSIERAVRRSPWVAAAVVDRGWPSTLTVRITERRPVALAEAGNAAVLLVAADGTVLSTSAAITGALPLAARPTAYPYLPPLDTGAVPGDVYTGNPSPLQVAASFTAALRDEVGRIRHRDGRVTLDLADGGSVMYGTARSMAAKNAVVLALLDHARERGIGVAYIDVTIPSSPVLRPAAG